MSCLYAIFFALVGIGNKAIQETTANQENKESEENEEIGMTDIETVKVKKARKSRTKKIDEDKEIIANTDEEIVKDKVNSRRKSARSNIEEIHGNDNGNSQFSVFNRPFTLTEILKDNRTCGIIEIEEDRQTFENRENYPYFDINKDIIEVFASQEHHIVPLDYNGHYGYTGDTGDTGSAAYLRYNHNLNDNYDDNNISISNDSCDVQCGNGNHNNVTDYNINDNYHEKTNNNNEDIDSDDVNDNNEDSRNDNKKKSSKNKGKNNVDNERSELINNQFSKYAENNTQLNIKENAKKNNTAQIRNKNIDFNIYNDDNDDNNSNNTLNNCDNNSPQHSTISRINQNTDSNNFTEIKSQNELQNIDNFDDNNNMNDMANEETEQSKTEILPGYNTIVMNNMNEIEDRIKQFKVQKKLYLLEREKIILARVERQEERDRRKTVKIDKRYAAKITEKSLSSNSRMNGDKRTRFERNVRNKMMNSADRNTSNNSNYDLNSNLAGNKRKKSDQSAGENNSDVSELRNVPSVKKLGTSSSILSRRKNMKEIAKSVEKSNEKNDDDNNNNNNSSNSSSSGSRSNKNSNHNDNNNNDNNYDNNDYDNYDDIEVNKSPTTTHTTTLLSKRKPIILRESPYISHPGDREVLPTSLS